MNLTRDRIRSISWAFVLAVCGALTFALVLRVNAVKGNVHVTEREIVALKQEIRFLEIEFQSRANQHHLDALNEVEFGYTAPTAGQYIEGERQLAMLGKPRAADAPAPIRMAAARPAAQSGNPLIAMVSPVRSIASSSRSADGPATARRTDTGEAGAQESGDLIAHAIGGGDIAERLTRIDVTEEDAQ